MKNTGLTSSEIQAAKASNNYKFTRTELEAVILVQRRIIESLEEEVKKLRKPHVKYHSPSGELPETD